MKHTGKLLFIPLCVTALALFVSCSLFDASTQIEADGDVISDSLLIDESIDSLEDNIRFYLDIRDRGKGQAELYLNINVYSSFTHMDFSGTYVDVAIGGSILSVDSLWRSSLGGSYIGYSGEHCDLIEGVECRIMVVGPYIGTTTATVTVPPAPISHSVKDTVYASRDALLLHYEPYFDTSKTVSHKAYSYFISENGDERVISNDIIRRTDTTILFRHVTKHNNSSYKYSHYVVRSHTSTSASIPGIGKGATVTCYSPYSKEFIGY